MRLAFRRVAVTGLGLALLVACSAPPAPAPVPSDSSATAAPAGQAERDQRIRDALNRREDALEGLWKKSWDKRSWHTVSGGYMPDVERYDDRLNLALKDDDLYPTRDRLVPATVYGADSSIVVAAQEDPQESQSVSVFSWRGDDLIMLYTFPWTHSSLMPAAAPQASIAPADATLTKQLTRYWETGRLPDKVTLEPNGTPFTFSLGFDEPEIKETYSCKVYEQGGNRFAWTLPVETGLLSLVAIDCVYRARASSNFVMGLDEDEAAITGDKRVVYRRLDCRIVYQMLVMLGDTDQVKWQTIGAKPRDVCARS